VRRIWHTSDIREEDSIHSAETEKLLRDGRARDRLACGIRLLICFENLSQVSDDLSGWDAVCWCAASIFV
jgi:hypothetical protein